MPENGRLSASGLSWENTDDFRRKHASKGLKAEAGRQAGPRRRGLLTSAQGSLSSQTLRFSPVCHVQKKRRARF